MPEADDDRWLTGRTRHVRVYLTEEEHAIVRQAAAQEDKSVSRFSIESIVGAARASTAKTIDSQAARPSPKKGRASKK